MAAPHAARAQTLFTADGFGGAHPVHALAPKEHVLESVTPPPGGGPRRRLVQVDVPLPVGVIVRCAAGRQWLALSDAERAR